MRRSTELPELLAPAGSPEALYAAVSAGADAVYLGGRSFGARAYAKNFDAEELKSAVRYCHLHGVRVYVTVNTLVYDREMAEAVAFCRDLYAMGVDAVISADLGLISTLRAALPDLEIHASTQMSLHNTAGARFAADLGVARVVLARELSRADIAAAINDGPCEVEVFLHGALCVCHSGQCLFSSLVGGRSGNRGECAQPCRLPYNGKYPLSLKDSCLSAHIAELVDMGVASLKIEGRMKSPSYVYEVTSVYRRLLDEHRPATEKENERLARAFSRGGFTDGYFVGKPDGPMTGVRSEADKNESKKIEERTFAPEKIRVRGRAVFTLGVPSTMTLTDGVRTVTYTGETPTAAQSCALNTGDLTTRLCKMGNTFLSLAEGDLEVLCDENINLSPGAVNALRRGAAELFEGAGRTLPDEVTLPTAQRQKVRGRTAAFYTRAGLDGLTARDLAGFSAAFVALPLFIPDDVSRGVRGVILPPVVFDSEWEEVRALLHAAKDAGVTAALVTNPSGIALAKEAGLALYGDFRLNVCNGQTAAFYRALGVERQILSPELSLPMMRDVGGAAIVYGRIPLMLTERCFVRENGGCEKCGRFAFTDRMGKKFPVIREYPHRNQILNAVPTYMGDRREDLEKYGVAEHFLFTTEGAGEIRALLSAYARGQQLAGEVRRIGK